jgi:hypothetical protein
VIRARGRDASLHLHKPEKGGEVRTLSVPEPQGVVVGRIPSIEVDAAELLEIFAFFGVADLEGVEGTDQRTVTLSASSNVVCPFHGRQLKPDACRSCSFLAGDQSRTPATGK